MERNQSNFSTSRIKNVVSMKNNEDVKSLFGRKEMFRMACTPTGKLQEFSRMAQNRRRKLTYNNMHLTEGMRFFEANGFPMVDPYQGRTSLSVSPFTAHCKVTDMSRALHFFLDDHLFDNAVWKNLDRTTCTLLGFDTLFAPDFSLYVDMPEELNRFAVYKSRFVAAFWQRCGFNVIPVASWAGAPSFRYCLDGLPTGSVIAVCGTGHGRHWWQRDLWHYGLRRVDEELLPTTILVYGEEESLPALNAPVVFIQDFIHSRLRKIVRKNISSKTSMNTENDLFNIKNQRKGDLDNGH